jgi:hypothetical protein
MDSLPVALLEFAFAWLDLDEIRAAKLVCTHWSACQAACSVVNGFPVGTLVQLDRIQVLHVEVTSKQSLSRLDASQLHDLKDLHLKLDASRVFPRTLHKRTLEGDFADLLSHVEWVFELPHAGILTKLFCLPRLRSLVLHKVITLGRGTHASPDCPLESLKFVDCHDLDLDFLVNLPRLQFLGFLGGTILPDDLPLAVRLGVTELDIIRDRLIVGWRQARLAVDLTGFPQLRRLGLEIGGLGISTMSCMHELTAAILSLKHLRQLNFNFSVSLHADWFIARLQNLTSLDVEFTSWPGPEEGLASCSTLRHLILREVPGHNENRVSRRLTRIRECAELRSLKLVGNSLVPAFLVTAELPSWIQCLELVGLWPSSAVSIPEVWMETKSFAAMPSDTQRALRSSVKNLYVVQKLMIRTSGFGAESSISRTARPS